MGTRLGRPEAATAVEAEAAAERKTETGRRRDSQTFVGRGDFIPQHQGIRD